MCQNVHISLTLKLKNVVSNVKLSNICFRDSHSNVKHLIKKKILRSYFTRHIFQNSLHLSTTANEGEQSNVFNSVFVWWICHVHLEVVRVIATSSKPYMF